MTRNPLALLDTPLRRVNAVVTTVALVAALVFPHVVSGAMVGTGFVALIYALRNVTWNIAGGYAGLLSLAHVAAFGIGAFAVSILGWQHGVNVWLAIGVGIVVSAVVGFLISLLMSRFGVNAFFFALGTLALTLAFAGVAAAWSFLGDTNGFAYTGSDEGLAHLMWFIDASGFYYVALAFLVVIVVGTALMMRFTHFGRSLVFLREDPVIAESMGIKVVRNQAFAMAISMGLTAIPGALIAQYVQFVSYESVLTVEIGVAMMVGTIIGGAGTLAGPVVAGIGIAALEAWLRSFSVSSANVSSYTQIVYAVLVIVLLRFGSGGIMPLWDNAIRRLFGRGRATGPAPAETVDEPRRDPELVSAAPKES